jgi:hypothetical protein
MSTPSLWKFTQYHESKKVLGMGYWFQMWAAVDVTYIDVRVRDALVSRM